MLWEARFFYYNGLGLDAWNVLHDGVRNLLNIKFGAAYVTVSIVMLSIAIIMGEKLGAGTILNGLLIGNFLQMNIDLGFLKMQSSPIWGMLYTIIGMIVTGIGYYFYMGAGMGSGPRDSFVVAVSRRLKIKVGYVKSLSKILAIIIGYLPGGYFGIATVITAIFTGITVQKVFDIMKFDPKTVPHESIKETLKKINRAR